MEIQILKDSEDLRECEPRLQVHVYSAGIANGLVIWFKKD